MFKIKYKMVFSIALACFMTFTAGVFDTASAADNLAIKKKQKVETSVVKEQPVACETINSIAVQPLDVAANPVKYLNQNIVMNATFDKFSTLGLDYKKALRESKDYIGFLIQRDDVQDHNIPLSEMKLFLKRDYAEKFIDLDTGDRIEITGHVFSNALGDAWIDVNNITVLKKAKAEETPKK